VRLEPTGAPTAELRRASGRLGSVAGARHQEALVLGHDGVRAVEPRVVARLGNVDEAEIRIGRDEGLTLLGRPSRSLS
jgi:hypothetical protein